MKHFIVLLSVLLCTTVYADTVNINWGSDNQLYTTTTCTIGGDVILPAAPAKRGYTFKGWEKNSFNRGTYTSWSNVPSTNTGYALDIYDNRTPKENDYIIVENSNNYVDPDNKLIIEGYLNDSARYLKITDNKTVIKDARFTINNFPNNSEYGTNVRVKIIWTDSRNSSWVALTKLKEDSTTYEVGDTLFSANAYFNTGTLNHTYSKYADYSGTWRFIYHGIWENDGKDGWKPDIQISQ